MGKYADKPQKLKRDIQRIRQMNGCGNAIQFFEGVEVKETFEKNWEPLESEPSLTRVKLIIILELYFQLTPITMVPETPEIIDLGNSSGHHRRSLPRRWAYSCTATPISTAKIC